MRYKMRLHRFAIVMIGVACLTACLQEPQTPPTTASAPPAGAGSQLASLPGLQDAVAVDSVEGGDDSNPLWTPASFKPTLQKSLAKPGYLAPRGESALYAVQATLVRLEQPSTGTIIEARSVVAYTVIRKADGTVILNRTIAASYTAATFEAAADGSIHANVEQFVGVLSETYALLPEAEGTDGMTLASRGNSNADPTAPGGGTQEAALQQEFDAWLYANRESFNEQLGAAVGGSAASLQQVSSARVVERNAKGYVVDVTYTIGNVAASRSETGRFLFALDGKRRLAGVDEIESI